MFFLTAETTEHYWHLIVDGILQTICITCFGSLLCEFLLSGLWLSPHLFERSSVTVTALLRSTFEFFRTSSRSFNRWLLLSTMYCGGSNHNGRSNISSKPTFLTIGPCAKCWPRSFRYLPYSNVNDLWTLLMYNVHAHGLWELDTENRTDDLIIFLNATKNVFCCLKVDGSYYVQIQFFQPWKTQRWPEQVCSLEPGVLRWEFTGQEE